MPLLKSSQSNRSEAVRNESPITGDTHTTAILQQNSRRPSSASNNCRSQTQTMDDVGKSSSRKPNLSRPRGTRPSNDNIPASGKRAQSTHRSNRLTDDGDKSSKTTRPKSLLRCRSTDNDTDSPPVLRIKDQKKDIHRSVEANEESSRRSIRPMSARRCRSTEDGSVSPASRLKPTSEQNVRPAHDATRARATRPKSVQRDHLSDSNPITAVPIRKESIRPNQRPRKDPIIDSPDDPLNRERTKSQTAVVDKNDEQITSEKERRNSTTMPRSNGTDRRRRCSTTDITGSVQLTRPVNNDRRKSDFVRSSDSSHVPTKDPSQLAEHRRHSRTPREHENKDAEKTPRRVDVRKRSSPDIDTMENVEEISQKAVASKSKSVRNGSMVKNTPEREEQIVKRSLVRKPSIKIPENRNSDPNESDSSQNIIIPTAVIQFDPTQQSGVVVIAPEEEIILQEDKEPSRTLVRKPSLSPIVCGNDTEQASEFIDHQSGLGRVRKPSQVEKLQESHDDDDGNDDSSSAPIVYQFVPSHESSVAHAIPHDNDDSVSVASEMENSWAAPILAFHDSDGEELDEKPIFRRPNNSTKLLKSIQQRRPSMSDSVHTKSSESHTTSSSLGRPQYYAPPLRNPPNTANSLAASFAQFIEKDQTIDGLNANGSGDKLPVKSKSRKKKLNDDVKVDADDEKSQVGQTTKSGRSAFKKDASNDRKKSLLCTSNHSTHSLLASDSDDDSYDDDRRMSNVFKPTPLNDIVQKNAVHLTAYESEAENDATTTTKKGKGSGIGKFFFGGGSSSSNTSTHSRRQTRSQRDTTVDGSDVSDSEHSCSSMRSNSSRRSGVFKAATRRLMKSSSNRHALLGDGDVENDVVPFSW